MRRSNGAFFPECVPPVKTPWLAVGRCRGNRPCFLWTEGEPVEVRLEPGEGVCGNRGWSKLLVCAAQERVAPAKNSRSLAQIKERPFLFSRYQVPKGSLRLIRIARIDHHVVDLVRSQDAAPVY